LTNPITFYYRSIYKTSKSYAGSPGDDAFPAGIWAGNIGDDSNRFIAVGYTWCFFDGPDPGSLPALSIKVAGTNTVITWPGVTNDFTLEANPNPYSPGNWLPTTNLPVAVGTNCVVTNASSGTLFYRLRRDLEVNIY
jgi:hypothetical protein